MEQTKFFVALRGGNNLHGKFALYVFMISADNIKRAKEILLAHF